jgi:CHASE2 domain-containing sensor protein
MNHHDTNQPILSVILSVSGALISIGNFVPLVQITAGLVGIATGVVALHKQLKRKK